MDNGKSAANGAKAFGGIMAVGAMATFGWMLWQAQSSRTETLERLTNQRLVLLEQRIEEAHHHAVSPAHPVATERLAAVKTEIDTIRTRMREDDARELNDIDKRSETLTNIARQSEILREIETQFRHMDRLIQLLWQRVYQEPLPNPPERGP